ncbi:protein TsetseEP-like [Camellia sinensis]|uniref:protein TsetseEP-like n=1 Tax=Camellia sinensis TaxID=4442 RepID=UPI0010364EA6|nr:protein TsetseEP-like [Camellia sinensis]
MPGSSDINSNEENLVGSYDIESDPSEEVEMPIEYYESEPELDPEPDPEIEPEPESEPESDPEEIAPINNPNEIIVIESDTEEEMPGSSDINSNEENSVENYDIESDPSEEVEMPIKYYESDPELDLEPDPELEPEPESEPESDPEEIAPINNPNEIIVIESDTEEESIEGNTD